MLQLWKSKTEKTKYCSKSFVSKVFRKKKYVQKINLNFVLLKFSPFFGLSGILPKKYPAASVRGIRGWGKRRGEAEKIIIFFWKMTFFYFSRQNFDFFKLNIWKKFANFTQYIKNLYNLNIGCGCYLVLKIMSSFSWMTRYYSNIGITNDILPKNYLNLLVIEEYGTNANYVQ